MEPTGDNRLSAFEVFFKENYLSLVYFARQILQNREASEDIVQDVFMKYLGREFIFTNETAARSFLYVSVKNACLNYLRQTNTRNKILQARELPKPEDSFVLQAIIKSEAMREINNAINELPEGCRTVLKLGYFEGLSNQEIAQHLSISINTVKTQKARALQLLRLKINSDLFMFLPLLTSSFIFR